MELLNTLDTLYDRIEILKLQNKSIKEMFTNQDEILKPLHKVWAKEKGKHTYCVPDRIEFFNWIVEKLNK